MILRVWPVPNEPTRFRVESHALQCTTCGKLYDRVQSECMEFTGRQRQLLRKVGVWDKVHKYIESYGGRYKVGDLCPKCEGTLDIYTWLVDIASYNLNGECDCHHFRCALEPTLRNQIGSEQGMGKFRCSHIDAARDFALDLSLKLHEHNRLKQADGRTEEDQP